MLRKFFLSVIVLISFVYIYGCNQFSDSNISNLPELKDLDVASFEKVLAENKGKVVLVNFFASWCPPCKAETPDFVATYNKFKDKDFVIIGISIDDDLSKAKQFIAEYKITYPTYHAKRELEEKMGVSSIPTNIFYTKDGTLYKGIVGAISADFLEKTIAELSR
ncbi:MAG: TlpA family protein disulfide reductase [Calditerrivibrio sp.]|nr:TlpA family protein disulfide reductase [Calditerrivibrio sp.]MCA1932979.1 TlpA family protein disulfide reductase [Calditerrivibrio sp.]MCA1980554.1 TlpA family protein disulfide reductase [Calditerrivibrio sp.]